MKQARDEEPLTDSQIELISPDNWALDWARLSRPGNIDVQLDLFGDYQSNLALYPKFQAFFRERRPPTLIVWGERDPFFTVAGARAYLRDLPHAELHLFDAAQGVLARRAAYYPTSFRIDAECGIGARLRGKGQCVHAGETGDDVVAGSSLQRVVLNGTYNFSHEQLHWG